MGGGGGGGGRWDDVWGKWCHNTDTIVSDLGVC